MAVLENDWKAPPPCKRIGLLEGGNCFAPGHSSIKGFVFSITTIEFGGLVPSVPDEEDDVFFSSTELLDHGAVL